MTVKGWQRKTIGDLCDFGTGHGFGPSDWSEVGLPIIRIQNLNGETAFNYFPGKPDPEWLVEPGMLLFAWAGTRGVSFGPTIWKGPKGVLNQHIYRVNSRRGVDPRWLYLALRDITNSIERKAHGFKSTLLHVGKRDITGQMVEVPPLPEQRKIADILTTWDETLEKLDALIAASECRKQGLMQQLLTGRRRLKGFTGKWNQTTFGELLQESRIQGSHGRAARKITVKLYGKGVVAKQERMIGSESTKYFIRRAGQFIYSKLDFLNGAFGIVPKSLDGFESTLDVPAFDVAKHCDARWLLAHVSRSEFYTRQLGAAAGGRKARRVNPSEFLALSVRSPDVTEQAAIARVLDTCDEELRLLRAQRAAIDQQKRGLMQRLLTGKVRVK
jgi:type I restriction enzyme, S subunit